MSQPSGEAEQPVATQHEPLISLADDTRNAASEEHSDEHTEQTPATSSAGLEDSRQDEDAVTRARPAAERVESAAFFSKDGLASEVNKDADHDVMQRDKERARSIEQEASEHLARRASEMMVEDGSPTAAPPVKHALPSTPPPPEPPQKDMDKGKAPVPIEDEDFDEKRPPPEPNQDFESNRTTTAEPTGLEIQTIMYQFEDGMGGPGEREIMSPRLEKQQPILQLPPRSSSLEPNKDQYISPQGTGGSIDQKLNQTVEGRPASVSDVSLHQTMSADTASLNSHKGSAIFQPPPPSPEPDAALPFDFHRFLEQLRHRTADPVARFLRSFLTEFGKKQWAVHEQVKIISDFLEFITKKMAQCEVWRTVSDAEFDNAREGMEKLVMNRLYTQTFSPAIPIAESPRKRNRTLRSAADAASPHGPGRRGQHQEDVERDEVIAQKLRIYGWISEEHLDVSPIGDKGRKFLALAQKELLKINTYRAPRDKVICVLNSCKVIFGYLKNSKSDQSADSFVPLLIYTVLRAKPEHLVSNVQYIWRFRNQEKLGGEAGYYMSSLMGVVTFIENLDRTNLTISDEDFERNVEHAVSAIAERDRQEEYEEKTHATSKPTTPTPQTSSTLAPMQHLSEKGAICRAEVTPRNSMDAERSSPRRNVSQRMSEKSGQSAGIDSGDESDAVAGLLRTIQRPLSSIGRMFSEDAPVQQQRGLSPARTPLPGSTPRGLSPSPRLDRRPSANGSTSADIERAGRRLSAEDAAARQASAEVEQARKMRVQEHRVVSETLQGMFPNLDKEVIEDVVRAQEGNVGRAVDACLAMSG